MKKLPCGVSNFEKLISEDYYFVDKTKYIEQLENYSNSNVYFLRPRKFGKTLFTSTLMYYYDINSKDKFENLFNYVFDGKGNVVNVFINNCQFYFGEPVNIGGKYGYLMFMAKIDGKKEVNVKVKFKDGYFISNINLLKVG